MTSVRIAKSKFARIAISIFALAQLAGLAWLLAHRFVHAESMVPVAKFAMATLFIWHLILLPVLLLLGMALLPVLILVIYVRRAQRLRNFHRAAVTENGALSRRQFLGIAIAATPPLLNLSLGTIAMRQLDQFRVRRFDLLIADLPRDLQA